MLDLFLELKTLLIFQVVFCVIVAYFKTKPPRRNFPPGPPVTPFLGNLKWVTGNSKLHKTYVELRKRYGPFFSVQLGWYPHVVIADYKLIKEALIDNGNQFSNRFNHIFFLKFRPHAKKGIIFGEGELWKATRRLAMSSLRDFGLGKDTIEQRIVREAEVLLKEISKHRGEPFKFDLVFNKAAANVMCVMLFGKRYEYADKDFIELLNCMNSLTTKGFVQSGPALFLPFAFPVVFLSPSSYRVYKFWGRIGTFVKKQIKEHRENFDRCKIKDFVDVYLDAEGYNSGEKIYDEMNLFKSILDLLLAGAETTSTTLLWGILFMLKHPDIQDKCRQEIMQSLGCDTKPSLKDLENLPYVEAVICEIQRLGNIVPHNLHSTMGNVQFHGYTLPDKTVISPDYYSVHMDPELWDDPEQFKPERFLDENNKVVRPPFFMPFGIGKRSCLGENLAKAELFLFFTSLLQNYRFTCADRSKLPTLDDGKMGLTLYPGQYEVMANPIVF